MLAWAVESYIIIIPHYVFAVPLIVVSLLAWREVSHRLGQVRPSPDRHAHRGLRGLKR